MALYGTVVNGVVVIDGPPLPEGTRVRVGLKVDDSPIPQSEEIPVVMQAEADHPRVVFANSPHVDSQCE